MNVSLENIDEQELDRFEARSFGRMSEEEARAFDTQLVADPEFNKRYRAFQLVIKGIVSSRDPVEKIDPVELRRRIRKIDRELDGESSKNWWLWAAAAVLLICGTVWLIQRPSTNEQLANEFDLPEPGLPVLMNTTPGMMDAIMNAYKQEQYTTADQLLRNALEQDPDNDTLHYFSGVVAEKIHDRDAAMFHYDQVDQNAVLGERAIYRNAICHLREGNIPEARTGLTRVRSAADPQVRQRAVALLDRL